MSLLADEAKDTRKTEQLALVMRYYNETMNCIQECFISFTAMINLDAASITDVILTNLRNLGLDYKSSLVGLGFDGASVMRGKVSGVQQRIREEAPLAHYIHCYGHKLNLVLINVANRVSEAAEFFALLEDIYIFMSNSVIHQRFVAVQEEMFPNEKVRELQHLSDTRWWCRATSCRNALLRLECIVKILRQTAEEDKGARVVSARGLLAQVDKEFVYLLYFSLIF